MASSGVKTAGANGANKSRSPTSTGSVSHKAAPVPKPLVCCTAQLSAPLSSHYSPVRSAFAFVFLAYRLSCTLLVTPSQPPPPPASHHHHHQPLPPPTTTTSHHQPPPAEATATTATIHLSLSLSHRRRSPRSHLPAAFFPLADVCCAVRSRAVGARAPPPHRRIDQGFCCDSTCWCQGSPRHRCASPPRDCG
jgi:hypothetical protein